MSANDRLVDLELLVAASNFEISVAAVVPHSEESISDVMCKPLRKTCSLSTDMPKWAWNFSDSHDDRSAADISDCCQSSGWGDTLRELVGEVSAMIVATGS